VQALIERAKPIIEVAINRELRRLKVPGKVHVEYAYGRPHIYWLVANVGPGEVYAQPFRHCAGEFSISDVAKVMADWWSWWDTEGRAEALQSGHDDRN